MGPATRRSSWRRPKLSPRLGISSSEVINELTTALQGNDEDRRDLVVAAIQKMDPLAAIERVPADVVFDGVISARSAATSPKSTSNNPRLERLLSELGRVNMANPEEVLAATRNLAALISPRPGLCQRTLK